MIFQTQRLIFRHWQETDQKPWAAMNADPQVRRYFADVLTLEQSHREFVKCRESLEKNDWGVWAVQAKSDGRFAGIIGLSPLNDVVPRYTGVEILWRLAKPYWGCGLATEGAQAVLDRAFSSYGLDKVAAITSLINKPSERVMQKIGLQKGKNFVHPNLPKTHPLSEHLFYKLNRTQFSENHQ